MDCARRCSAVREKTGGVKTVFLFAVFVRLTTGERNGELLGKKTHARFCIERELIVMCVCIDNFSR